MRNWIGLCENEHPWEALVWQVRCRYAPNFQGNCEGAAAELAELLKAQGIDAKVMHGMFDHPYDDGEVQCERSSHVWVEIPGYILDPTVEQFDSDQTIVPLGSEEARRYEGHEELTESADGHRIQQECSKLWDWAKQQGVNLTVHYWAAKNCITLKWIKRGDDAPKGSGAIVIDAVCALADKHLLPIRLHALSDRNDTRSLKAYYRQFGFVNEGGDNTMVRPAKVGSMRKIAEDIERAASTEEQRLHDFQALADAQRGAPEMAMVRAQHIMGGGVLNLCIEHVGDLTHRMTEHPDFIPYCGFESVKPKVDRCYRMLCSTYQPRSHPNEHGFYAEFMQNMRNNAAYYHPDLPPEEALGKYMERVTLALKKYADEHRKLKVYNRMQQAARDAAIALGDMDFEKAKALLGELYQRLDTPEHWQEEAGQYDPTYNALRESASVGDAPADRFFAALKCKPTGSWQGAVANYVLGVAEAHLIRRADDLVEIGSIYVPDEKRQSGFASKALKAITNAADACGLRLELDVHDSSEYTDRHSLTNLELEEWYGRFGFVYDQSHDTYFRKPRGL